MVVRLFSKEYWLRVRQTIVITWTDILLTWDPKKYGGVDEVRVPADKIWSPDIVLYNYADTRLKEHREAMAVVTSTGTVVWIPPAIFKSTCPIDITNFPFDIQECHMKFGSWTYDGFKLDLAFYEDVNEVDIRDYTESNEWIILDHPAIKNTKYYACCDEPYIDLTFTIKLKRIATFYSYILVLPCVLLSFLTLVIFWLPPESPAKMMLGMNIFIAFFVLLLLLAESTPPAASTIPLIGAYFCLNMILITLSTFLSVIVINLYLRRDKRSKVPLWVKRLMIDGLAHIFCMTDLLEEEANEFVKQKSRKASSARERLLSKPTVVENNRSKVFDMRHLNRSKSYSTARTVNGSKVADFHTRTMTYARIYATADNCSVYSFKLERDVREINHILQSYISDLDEKEDCVKIAREWRITARVLDRLFFAMYVSTIIVSLATIFPKG